VTKLIYASIASLDGYIADEDGKFDWAVPDDDVFAYINDTKRPIGTYLYGRRTYEMMIGWETDPAIANQSPLTRDFAEIWQAADKIVYSSTLETVSTARTRLERRFDPERVQRLKAELDHDLTVGGPDLAAHAIRAGLVDEYHLYVVPVVVGGGKRFLPRGVHVPLELLDERRFPGGTVHLRYRARA
jgi:dihydrofolate reductase